MEIDVQPSVPQTETDTRVDLPDVPVEAPQEGAKEGEVVL